MSNSLVLKTTSACVVVFPWSKTLRFYHRWISTTPLMCMAILVQYVCGDEMLRFQRVKCPNPLCDNYCWVIEQNVLMTIVQVTFQSLSSDIMRSTYRQKIEALVSAEREAVCYSSRPLGVYVQNVHIESTNSTLGDISIKFRVPNHLIVLHP